jgi:hypothetical protein
MTQRFPYWPPYWCFLAISPSPLIAHSVETCLAKVPLFALAGGSSTATKPDCEAAETPKGLGSHWHLPLSVSRRYE